jgi:SAM-dependent methyltransferase
MANYSPSFYAAIADDGVSSARVVVPDLLELVGPVGRVLDLGCGVGSWLSVFIEQGAAHVVGVDGPYVPAERLRIPFECFVPHDLRLPFSADERYDLAVSLEVAEHLPAPCAAGFVASLVEAAPFVLFSAAIPGQGGTGHVNEQWPEYWAELFEAHDYVTIDALRPRVWDDERVSSCVAQNILLFAERSRVDASPALQDAAAATRRSQLALVHPRRYEMVTDPRRVAVRRAVATVPRSVAGAIARRRGRNDRAVKH